MARRNPQRKTNRPRQNSTLRRKPKPLLPRRRQRGAATSAGSGPAPGSLADAFGAAGSTDGEGLVRAVRLGEIRPNCDQPRRRIDEDKLALLAESIRAHGVLQPPLVRELGEGYELIAGERRWRAAQQAGLEEIPVFVRPAAGADALELALIENVAREDITPIEEARSLATLIDDLGVTQSELGERVGMSQSDISHSIRLLDLPEEALDMIDDGTLTKNHGKALLGERKRGRRLEFARKAAAQGWSVRRLTEAIAAKRGQGGPPRRGPRPTSAGLRKATQELAERLDGRLAAHTVRIVPRGQGVAIQIVTETVDEARAIVDLLASKRKRAS